MKDTFTPLFNIQLHIQGKQIQTSPDLRQLSETLTTQIETIQAAAQPFVMWAPGSATMEKEQNLQFNSEFCTPIKRGQLYYYRVKSSTAAQKESESMLRETVYVRSYYIKVSNDQQIIKVGNDIKDKIQQTTTDLDFYLTAWNSYE